MTNNDIFKKLRVALMLRDDEIVDILQLADFKIGKSELGAFFRKEDHPNYMECGDQVLRNFLNGLVIHLRGTKENPKHPGDVLSKKTVKIADQATVKASEKKAGRINERKKPSFKDQQRRKMDTNISNVKYKNKPARKEGGQGRK